MTDVVRPITKRMLGRVVPSRIFTGTPRSTMGVSESTAAENRETAATMINRTYEPDSRKACMSNSVEYFYLFTSRIKPKRSGT